MNNIIGKFTLKRANKLFPDKYTRISPHDFLSLACKKRRFISKKEKENLCFMASDDQDKRLKRFGYARYSDLLIERNGRKLTIISL